MSRQFNPQGFILYKSSEGWRYRIQGNSGAILCVSSPFKRKRVALDSVESCWKAICKQATAQYFDEDKDGMIDAEIQYIL